MLMFIICTLIDRLHFYVIFGISVKSLEASNTEKICVLFHSFRSFTSCMFNMFIFKRQACVLPAILLPLRRVTSKATVKVIIYRYNI